MTTPTFPRPSPTPQPLKAVLWAIFIASIAGYILPLTPYLGLSHLGLSHGYFWTYLTYPFTYPYPHLFDLVFHLIFNLIFLWVFGLPLLDRLSSKRFLILFFGSTLFAGLIASLYFFHSYGLLAGPNPPLLALVTAWVLLNAERPLVFKPLWIFLLIVAVNILLDAITGAWVQLLADTAAVVFAYFFCLVSEKVRSTMPWLYPFERAVLRSLDRHPVKPRTAKVIDFQTGEPVLDDEQFMDAMLARISLYGEEGLTEEERKRMQKISKGKVRR